MIRGENEPGDIVGFSRLDSLHIYHDFRLEDETLQAVKDTNRIFVIPPSKLIDFYNDFVSSVGAKIRSQRLSSEPAHHILLSENLSEELDKSSLS